MDSLSTLGDIDWTAKQKDIKEQLIANFESLGLDGVVFGVGKNGKLPYGQIKKYFRENGDTFNGGSTANNGHSNSANTVEKFQYYYHPDHLGSSSYITDANGEVSQHTCPERSRRVEYFPFGERRSPRKHFKKLYSCEQTFVEQHHGHDKYSNFKFNGKELDEATGLYYYGARYYDPRISMWYGVDIMSDKYPSLSPYAYCANNPVILVDPDGREVYIHGADASKAVAALQKKTSLQLSYDAKTGMLSAMGKAESKLDKELLGAIGDQGIKVNLYTMKENSFKSRDGSTQPISIGGYDGSEVKDGVVKTTQYINMEHAEKAEKGGLSNQGSDVFHEAIESYYGAQNDPGGIYDLKKWEESHNKANEADPSASKLNRNLNTKTGQAGLINPSNGKSVDLRPITNNEKKAAGIE